jgi:hypothetical protein
MKLAPLRKLLTQRPFKPFLIHLPGGQAILVEQSEWLAVSQTGDAIIAVQGDGSFERDNAILLARQEGIDQQTLGNHYSEWRSSQ